MGNRVTMGDIAARMNLSKCTVSTALSDKYGVSEELRSRIILTAMEMGYDFDRIRRRPKRNNAVALLIGDDSYLSSAFWLDVIVAIEQGLDRHGKVLNLLVLKAYEDFSDVILRLANRSVEGILLLADGDEDQILRIAGLGKPLVLVDSKKYVGLSLHQMRMSNYESGYAAAQYFYAHGFRNLAFVGNRNFSYSFRQRANGFRVGAEELGCRFALFDRGSKPEEGFNPAEIDRLLHETDFPVGVFVGNDYVAVDLWYRARSLGLRVPEQVSMIGFDHMTHDAPMRLTTFDVPKKALGDKAVELLMRVLEDPAAPPEIVSIGSKLIEGDTVAAL